ncbi:gliding motility lipoprotein GldH [Bacteroides zhangwenhongii]|uniref:Gliding motility lipoprotein GldH n=1 Tax=Bacteroides zhangwenhongii TaxID=2650157 RepID=A0ABT5H5R1_9BACE|nr:gliding motility lipoprotein GldH [Bacteroides zhangwenhongii]MDC7135854.1 gliding motility lipoprotein GldH [Bacteroides zhangwenhongii]OKZ23346.1 MAG: gliding motility lipoprotein GldH [Bacteroides finegoldii]
MKSLFRNSLFCLFTACLTAACNENTVYHSYQSLPDNGWGKSDTLSFFVPITDSLPPTLRLFAEVRNRTDYPYQDLHLFISQNLQDSTVWRTDTIAIHLTDSTGRWFGKGWGSVYQSETFIRSVRPLHPGNYTFKVVSGMKDDVLQGINDVGIRISR